MNRTIRIILIILMMFWLFWIPSLLYFFWAKPKGGRAIRFILWILTLIPAVNLIGAIGLLLVELRIIDVDGR